MMALLSMLAMGRFPPSASAGPVSGGSASTATLEFQAKTGPSTAWQPICPSHRGVET